MRKILFYDPYTTGHHSEYLAHPIHYLRDRDDLHAVIVCSKKLINGLRQYAGECGSKVTIDEIDEAMQLRIDTASNLWARGRADAACFADSIAKHCPDLAISLYINPMQPFLNSAGFRRSDVRLRGILFDPFPLQERLSAKTSNLKARITRLRKTLQIRWMIRNPQLEKFFILNDAKIAKYFSGIGASATGRFDAIPDPIPLYLSCAPFVSSHGQKDGRITMLLIGSIDRRKGLIETFNALSLLPAELKPRVSLRVVGRFSGEALRSDAIGRIRALRSEGFMIELDEGWVSDEQFKQEVCDSSLVLAPYVGFHGSSGVIGHAAFFRKPLLATSGGLIGEIVRKSDIGRVIDPQDAPGYSRMINVFVAEPWDCSRQQREYSMEMSSTSFMGKLLEELPV